MATLGVRCTLCGEVVDSFQLHVCPPGRSRHALRAEVDLLRAEVERLTGVLRWYAIDTRIGYAAREALRKREKVVPPGEDYTKLNPFYLARVIESRDADIENLRADIEQSKEALKKINELDEDDFQNAYKYMKAVRFYAKHSITWAGRQNG
jgi:hypothetical protein